MKMQRRGPYLVNVDNDAFTKYRALRNINEARDNQLKHQRQEIDTLRHELQELKDLIKGLDKWQST